MISATFSILNLIFIASAQVISVCPSGCDFSSIKVGLQNVSDGGVLVVKGGSYKEGPIVIDRTLSIKGEGNPTIVGDGNSSVITIHANSVKLSGLHIIDSGASYLAELAAILVEESVGCVISDNILENNAYGVYLARAEHCLVQNNRIDGTRKSESESGNGVHIWDGRYHNAIITAQTGAWRQWRWFNFGRSGRWH